MAKVYLIFEDYTDERGQRGYTARVAERRKEPMIEGALTIAQAIAVRTLAALRDDTITLQKGDVLDVDDMH